MPNTDHDWITVHRARFAKPVDATEQDFRLPAEATCARLGIDTHLGDDGLPVLKSDIWGAWSICRDRTTAERIMDAPFEHFPFLQSAIETWHGLLIPYSHHGDVNWNGTVESDSAIRPAADPGTGPVAVLTTAAFNTDAPEELPRVREFLASVWPAREHFRSCKGNGGAALFVSCDDREGITFSLWDSEASMVSAAYVSGLHHDLLKRHRTIPFFDRSSFTRTRVAASHGKWDGQCPLERAAS